MGKRAIGMMEGRSRILLLAVASLSGPVALVTDCPAAAPWREPFRQANQLYEAGEYRRALELYQEVAATGAARELHYNLGNCHFQLGETGRACLAYRRALLFDPGMVEARQNLEFLQGKLGFLTFSRSGLERAVGRLTVRQWVAVTVSGAWLLVLGAASLWVFRPRQPVGGVVLAMAISGAMIALAGAWAWSFFRARLDPASLALVVEDGALALTGPFPDAKPVMSLPPGSELRIEAERDDWVFVYIPGDSAGWIHGDSVESLWPSSR